jgi:hypothetical protein
MKLSPIHGQSNSIRCNQGVVSFSSGHSPGSSPPARRCPSTAAAPRPATPHPRARPGSSRSSVPGPRPARTRRPAPDPAAPPARTGPATRACNRSNSAITTSTTRHDMIHHHVKQLPLQYWPRLAAFGAAGWGAVVRCGAQTLGAVRSSHIWPPAQQARLARLGPD